MMVKHRCILIMSLSLSLFGNLSVGQPAPEDQYEPKKKDEGSFVNLPFLEFGNGGVRVNFGGYHAEAGLGGLFGGSGTRGGLYAGAGTPFGAHASADLGGTVGGDKGGITAGGLRARAGLGNGRPEAAAGLGGNLDGSNNGANGGGRLYAGASNGAKTKLVIKEAGVDQSHIQVIPKNADANPPPVVPVDASAEAGVSRREINTPDDKLNSVEPIQVPAGTDTPPQSAYPSRRCRRKRLCNNFLRKALVYQYPGNQIPDLGASDIPAVSGVDATITVEKTVVPKATASANVSGGLYADATTYKDVAVAAGPAPVPPPPYPVRPRTIFDDIFNIPISTLAAVNQLLNGKVG